MLDGLWEGMRDTVLRTLDTPVGVRARTRVRTSSGGSTYTWGTPTQYAGRFMATSNQEQEFAVKMGIAATHVCILAFDATVAVDDRLVVDGLEYSITGVMEHQSPVLVKVLCARVEE